MRRYLIALLAAAAATACDQAEDPVASGREPVGPSRTVALSQVAQDPTPDQLAVARAVPGFGGYFIDETGAPTVWLTDPSRRPEAEQALAGFLDSFGWTAADLKVRQADYDYLQLDAWYTQAWKRALQVSGAVSTDLDEGRNRLRFTGLDASALAGIVNVLTGLDIPRAAAVVELRGPVFRVATLRDRIRPAHGGLQINFFLVDASPASYVCTIGFNALRGEVKSFITNSHCSNVQGGVETPTQYYQANRRTGSVTGGFSHFPGVDPAAFIATEVDDPHYWISLDCPLGRTCRYSDASRAQYNAGEEFVMGRIARTLQPNATVDSVTIDGTNPTFRIVAEQPNPVMGQVLNKVGRTTGWTQGVVVSTCENISVTDSPITQLCQSLVTAYVAGGDSGSPVFGFNTDGTVNLAGILWGSSTDLVTNEVQFIFSPLAAVERELGELTTADPLPVTTGKPKKKAR
ncbi:MAG TPA: hypothetical protein VFX98_04825 [Longimicrobiaceae bacterium]|nr:hypothetical protein [Longimicrobiaceae bacterium]